MEPNELSDGLEEQAREREAEEELAEPAESDDMALTPDDLDGAAEWSGVLGCGGADY